MISIIAKAGNNTKSRYGVSAPRPTAANTKTRMGVKQHKATKNVPQIVPFNFFLRDCCSRFCIMTDPFFYRLDNGRFFKFVVNRAKFAPTFHHVRPFKFIEGMRNGRD